MSGWDWDRSPESGSEEEDEEGQGETYIVERILLKRTIWSGTEYFIKWQGYPESDNTWEPASNLQCPELLDEFERNWQKEREPPIKSPMHDPNPTAASSSTSNAISAAASEKPVESSAGHATTKRPATSALSTTNSTTDVISVPLAVASTAKKPRTEKGAPKARIDQIIDDGKRREILEAAERRLEEEQQRGLPDAASFERMKARKEAIEKAQEKVEREGGFNPSLTWKI